MTKFLSVVLSGALLAGVSLSTAAVAKETEPHHSKKAKHKNVAAKKVTPAPYSLAVPDDDDAGTPIDIAKAPATDYNCELGNQITIFRNEGDDKYIALKYQKLVTRMQRVPTTTGANRFENKKSGLVWIGIPAKGMLLDAKKGQQIANECRDKDQLMTKATVPETSAPALMGAAIPTVVAPPPAPDASAPTPAPELAPAPAPVPAPVPGTETKIENAVPPKN